MKKTTAALLLLLLCGCERYGLVEVTNRVRIDLRYGQANNFLGRRLYWEGRCFLREETARKLMAADAELRQDGIGLKVFDCYRPLSVQREMWSVLPDDRYVADPAKGSRHNRGAAVDVTLVRLSDGSELFMPTPHDDFSPKAHRSYTELEPDQIANRKRLEDAMQRNGFVGLPTEWWHFDDTDWQKHPVLDIDLRTLSPRRGSFARQ